MSKSTKAEPIKVRLLVTEEKKEPIKVRLLVIEEKKDDADGCS